MKAHVIENEKVINTIEVESLDFMANLVEATDGGIGWGYVDGEFIPPPGQTLEDAKAEIKIKINSLFKTETALIKNGVAQEEIDTFPTQEKEAIAYQADDQADVPLLTGLATVRGMEVSELAARVLAHASAYKAAIAQVMGKKHKLEDQVGLAETIEALDAIEVV